MFIRSISDHEAAILAINNCAKPEGEEEEPPSDIDNDDPWANFPTALMFTFTVVTTIG